jgi:hypothetical protein
MSLKHGRSQIGERMPSGPEDILKDHAPRRGGCTFSRALVGSDCSRFAAVLVLVVALRPQSAWTEPKQTAMQPSKRTLQRKLIVGYQGWFGCPDSSRQPPGKWVHWMKDGEATIVIADRSEAQGIGHSRAYQRHRGHIMVGVFGLGFAGSRYVTADLAEALIDGLRKPSLPYGGITIFARVPVDWRTLSEKGAQSAEWGKVYRSVDVISALGRSVATFPSELVSSRRR